MPACGMALGASKMGWYKHPLRFCSFRVCYRRTLAGAWLGIARRRAFPGPRARYALRPAGPILHSVLFTTTTTTHIHIASDIKQSIPKPPLTLRPQTRQVAFPVEFGPVEHPVMIRIVLESQLDTSRRRRNVRGRDAGDFDGHF